MKYSRLTAYFAVLILIYSILYFSFASGFITAPVVLLVGAWAPNLAVAVVLGVLFKEGAVFKKMIKNLFQWRLGAPLYFTVFLFPVVYAVTIILFRSIYQVTSLPEDFNLVRILSFAPVIILGGAIGEELGWRGLVFAELRKFLPLLPSAILVTAVWAMAMSLLWLVPEFGYSATPYGGMLAAWLGIGIVLCYLVEHSGGSLFGGILVRYFGYQSFAFAMGLGLKIDPYIYYYAAANLLIAMAVIVYFKFAGAKSS